MESEIERERVSGEPSRLFSFLSLFMLLGRRPSAPYRGFASHLLLFDSHKDATQL